MLLDKIVDLIVTNKKKKRHQKLCRYKDDPETIQREILAKIIKDNKNTEFGKTHGFADIDSVEAFQAKVPVKTSAQYLDYLSRVYQGEHNVLTFEAPYYFAMTTGSTGDYKRIPITKTFRNETDNSMFAFVQFMEMAFPEIKNSAIQFLVGSGDGGESPVGVPQGFVSGFNYKSLPKVLTRRFVIPYWVFTLEDAEDRYYAMARFMIGSPNLVAVAAISPLNLTNVAKSILSNIERLVFDLTHQKLTLSAANQAMADEHDFDQMPEKLSALRTFNEGDSVSALMDKLLPHLKYLVTWSGGNMAYSLAETQRYFGEKTLFEMPFSASEGLFAVPYKPNIRGGIAAVTGHFLEYIPEDEIDDDNPTVLPVWSLEKGKTYYQVVTTSGGLYRYNMEDLIVVSDFWGKLPVVEFLSKRARQVSINNERITEQLVTDATVQVCRKYGIHFDHFIYFPCREGYYTLVVDDEPMDMQVLIDSLDKTLREICVGYEIDRGNLRLEPVRIAVVDKQELTDFVRAVQFKSKLPSGQFKPLHLSNQFSGHQTFNIKKEIILGEVCHEDHV